MLSFEGPSFSWLGRQIVNLEVAGSNPVGPAFEQMCGKRMPQHVR